MEIEGASLYQMNKQLSANEKVMSAAAQKKAQEEARLWFMNQGGEYSMLLCHEQRDYTVFHKIAGAYSEAAAALFECINNRGELISIEPADGGALEIWIRMIIVNGVTDDGVNLIETEEDFCYYLFNYDSAIINY